MKKPQLITITAALALVAALYFLIPTKGPREKAPEMPPMAGKMMSPPAVTTDSVLILAKKGLTPDQVFRINGLENSITRGAVKDQQLAVYHQLAHFWNDSAKIFELYAWYEAEAARLENSEKNLTFAARLFLDNLQQEPDPGLKQWKGLQAKDLFERSLKINPDNDSARVGLGACYLFGNISEQPMEGLQQLMTVVQKDSTNIYAQTTLARGALMSGQYDKAVSRLMTVYRIQPQNAEVILLLGEAAERRGLKAEAADWYSKSLPLVKNPDAVTAIKQRITELKK